jgi:hypothetical protein
MPAGTFAQYAHEIYRLAYEQAVAAARPSRYELAFAASPN